MSSIRKAPTALNVFGGIVLFSVALSADISAMDPLFAVAGIWVFVGLSAAWTISTMWSLGFYDRHNYVRY